MKKVITILLIILVLAAGVGFGVYHHKSNETKFNDDYINGNTAGNLYNAGIFCTAADGTIYFANPSDSSKLYSMNSDGSDLTKISDDVATFINADDNYIYYVRNNPVFTEPFSFLTINTDSLCRLDRSKHKKSILLDSSASLYASLVGNIRQSSAPLSARWYYTAITGGAQQIRNMRIMFRNDKLIRSFPVAFFR